MPTPGVLDGSPSSFTGRSEAIRLSCTSLSLVNRSVPRSQFRPDPGIQRPSGWCQADRVAAPSRRPMLASPAVGLSAASANWSNAFGPGRASLKWVGLPRRRRRTARRAGRPGLIGPGHGQEGLQPTRQARDHRPGTNKTWNLRQVRLHAGQFLAPGNAEDGIGQIHRVAELRSLLGT